jgi:uncharacterized delta-60 repeat protein
MKTRRQPTIENLEGRMLLSAGDLDLTFGGTGMAYVANGSRSDGGGGVAVQSDLKVVVAGSANNNNAGQHGKSFTPAYAFGVARFNANGTADPSFGSSGIVQTYFEDASGNPLLSQVADAVAIQTDGKIVVAGHTSSEPGDDFALARYNANGTLDPTFGGATAIVKGKPITYNVGRAVTDFFGKRDGATAVAIQPDGKIVAAGFAETTISGLTVTELAVARYNANGKLDTSFGSGGKAAINVSSSVDQFNISMAIDSQGRILLSGSTGTTMAVARFTSGGSLDPSFGTGGKVELIAPGFGQSYSTAIGLQSTGRIVIVGRSYNGAGYPSGDSPLTVARLNSDGTLDDGSAADTSPGDAFGAGGYYIAGGVADGKAVVVQADDKILALAATEPSAGDPRRALVTRILADGSAADTSFGAGGLSQQSDLAPLDGLNPSKILVAPDGKIVAGGSYDPGYFQGTNTRSYLAAVRFQGDAGMAPETAGALTASSGWDRIASEPRPAKIKPANYSDSSISALVLDQPGFFDSLTATKSRHRFG